MNGIVYTLTNGDWYLAVLTDGRRYRLGGVPLAVWKKSHLRELRNRGVESNTSMIDRTTAMHDNVAPFVDDLYHAPESDSYRFVARNGDEVEITASDLRALLETINTNGEEA